MIRWTGLAPWEYEFPFPGSLTSTFLGKDAYHVFRIRYWTTEGTPPPGLCLLQELMRAAPSSSSSVLSRLELSDTHVYEP